jgi:hypothetical protein
MNMPGWKRKAFADELKADIYALCLSFGCNLEFSEHKEKARPFLVAYGATARQFRPNYWLDRLFSTFTPGKVVITDVRYANEIGAIIRHGGLVVRISRPGYEPANSEEEKSFAEIDSLFPGLPSVVNSGTPEQLGVDILSKLR